MDPLVHPYGSLCLAALTRRYRLTHPFFLNVNQSHAPTLCTVHTALETFLTASYR